MKINLRIVFMSAFACAAAAIANAGEPALQLVSSGYVSPSNLLSVPGKNKDLIIADQVGVIYYLPKGKDQNKTLFLDLRSKLTKLKKGFDERGLLGVAFHPDYPEKKSVFVYYSAPKRKEAPEKWDHTSHISRFTVSENLKYIELESEKVLLQFDEPQWNHNSGRLAFGPDGLLYASIGDGGAGNDVGLGHGEIGNGQNQNNLLGSVIRIDVDKGDTYSIPKDNPFANGGGRPEIFAYGFRNPWGMSFDMGGEHELFLADVGQSRFEEVNIVQNGGNYGWRVREGFTGFDPKQAYVSKNLEAPLNDARGQRFIDPIVVYKNKGAFRKKDDGSLGISITGGYVYRGSELPEYDGKYIFGDWNMKRGTNIGILFVASKSGQKWSMDLLRSKYIKDGQVEGFVTAFGQDADGEVYVMTNDTNALINKSGKVYKLVSKD